MPINMEETIKKLDECAVLLRMTQHLTRIASEHSGLIENYAKEAQEHLSKTNTDEIRKTFNLK